MAEHVGRGMGNTAGYAVRGAAGTAIAEPWGERPKIPLWQKILGTFALLTWLSPAGWIVLAATFVVMVIAGGSTPAQWMAFVIKLGAWVVVAELVVLAMFGLYLMGQ